MEPLTVDEMTDEEFLLYCDGMTHTERCGFVPQNLARLFRLSGDDDAATMWAARPNTIISGCHNEIRALVELARAKR